MIAGLLVRNFKTYKGVNFIPFILKDFEPLQIFIGDNGTGKSSILEALDAYFNDGKWIQTTGQKDSYVAPVFLLEKAKFKPKFSEKSLPIVEKISNFFWNFTGEGNTIYSQVQGFLDFKDSIKEVYGNTHYLLLFGNLQDERSSLFFATFDKEVKAKELRYAWDDNANDLKKKTDQNTLDKVMEELDQMIAFIYVPAEENIAQFLKLESSDMQELVNRRIKEEIEEILKKPYSEGAGGKNILDFLNTELMPYIQDVEKTIQNIDPTYKFKGDNRSTKLNSRDLIGPIIRAFYNKRRLEKNNKPIDDLSSGEKKKALVDIVYSFLCQEGDKEKEIIFAIDEPESSLDSASRYDSFERVEKIANKHQHQTFITTHWYGLLPIVQRGIIHYLELSSDFKPIIKMYDARYFISERKKDPDDNYFKSFSDLSAAIFSSLKARDLNWIVVEGPDDKNYLDYYLSNLVEGNIDKFRILAAGGGGNVKLLHEHLYIPIKNSEAHKVKGNVLCLIDTDEGVMKTEFDAKTLNKKLHFKRLQNIKEEIKLIGADNVNYTQKTVIEDALEPRKFYDTLKIVIESSDETAVKLAFESFRFNETAKTSRIVGDGSILFPLPKENIDVISDKEIIVDYVNRLGIKEKLSIEYCKQPFSKEQVPNWLFSDLLSCFYDKEALNSFLQNGRETIGSTTTSPASAPNP